MEKFSFNQHAWHLIVNPNALSEKCFTYSKIVEIKLHDLNIPYQKHIANLCNAGIQIVKDLCLKGERYFMIVGGDGTINEVINGIFLSGIPTEEVYVSVIPLGTGNDWTRTHLYPPTYSLTIDQFNESFFIKQDVGLVETMENGQCTDKRYFINIAGFGFDSAVIQEVNKNKSKVFSKTVYLLSLLKVLLTHKAQKIEIKTDAESFTEPIFTIAIGIGQYNGNGMRQVPMANPIDGLFDMVIIKKVSPFKVIRNVKNLYAGTHLQSLEEAVLLHAKTIEITSTPFSTGEVEGELLKKGNYRISIIPNSLHVMSFNADFLHEKI
jgi:YegS/Rv2252/BmrU family lipid kinase